MARLSFMGFPSWSADLGHLRAIMALNDSKFHSTPRHRRQMAVLGNLCQFRAKLGLSAEGNGVQLWRNFRCNMKLWEIPVRDSESAHAALHLGSS
jgi:hypothetical protein